MAKMKRHPRFAPLSRLKIWLSFRERKDPFRTAINFDRSLSVFLHRTGRVRAICDRATQARNSCSLRNTISKVFRHTGIDDLSNEESLFCSIEIQSMVRSGMLAFSGKENEEKLLALFDTTNATLATYHREAIRLKSGGFFCF